MVKLKGKPLYQYTQERLAPQVSCLFISANRHIDDYQLSGLKVFQDIVENVPGPLAGMLSGFKHIDHQWIIFVPCDVPFIPPNLVDTLWVGGKNQLAAYINDGERCHPTIVLLHYSLTPLLENCLTLGERKLSSFLEQCNASPVYYPHPEYFININTFNHIRQAEYLLQEY